MSDHPPGEEVQIFFCALCNGPGSTRHHFAPVATKMPHMGTCRLCPRCHREVHYYFSNWELAVRFNSLESLSGELKIRRAFPIPTRRENKELRKARRKFGMFPPSDQ